MTTRRNFLKTSAAATAGSFLYPSIARAAPAKTIGLQLYTLRMEMETDPMGTLRKVAAIGYKEVESAAGSKGHYYGMKPADFRQQLSDMGLALRSSHVLTDAQFVPSPFNKMMPPDLPTLTNNLQVLVDNAAQTGQKYLVCAVLFPGERATLDDYKRHAQLFNQAGEACRKAGLQFCYHNHDFEFTALDGQLPYDLLLAETDSALVQMELDLYWVTRAGQDPVAYFKKHPGRFPLWHVKDMDNTDKKAFTEVGNGTIDFVRIFKSAATAGMKHYFVEQDESNKSPLESITISYRNLSKLKV